MNKMSIGIWMEIDGSPKNPITTQTSNHQQGAKPFSSSSLSAKHCHVDSSQKKRENLLTYLDGESFAVCHLACSISIYYGIKSGKSMHRLTRNTRTKMQRTPTVKRRNVGETTPPPRLDEEDCSVSQRHTKMSAAVLFRRDRALHHHFCSLSSAVSLRETTRTCGTYCIFCQSKNICTHILPHVDHWREQSFLWFLSPIAGSLV